MSSSLPGWILLVACGAPHPTPSTAPEPAPPPPAAEPSPPVPTSTAPEPAPVDQPSPGPGDPQPSPGPGDPQPSPGPGDPQPGPGPTPAPDPDPPISGLPLGAACLTADACASGVCEGDGCDEASPGICAPAQRACTRDRRPYCGCDEQTFYTSGSCPGRRYAHTGPCPGDEPGPPQ